MKKNQNKIKMTKINPKKRRLKEKKELFKNDKYNHHNL